MSWFFTMILMTSCFWHWILTTKRGAENRELRGISCFPRRSIATVQCTLASVCEGSVLIGRFNSSRCCLYLYIVQVLFIYVHVLFCLLHRFQSFTFTYKLKSYDNIVSVPYECYNLSLWHAMSLQDREVVQVKSVICRSSSCQALLWYGARQ